MAYLAVADFRTATLRWYTRDLELSTTEAPDTDLTEAISDFSDKIDLLTGDHFEPEPGGSPEGTTTLDLNGSGTGRLLVPKRIRSITAVHLRDEEGTLTAQLATDYRVKQSLVGGVRQEDDLDYIEIIPGQRLTDGSALWPTGPQTVRITGTFSWPSTPRMIKRATALLVWDAFRHRSPDQRWAERWNTADASYVRAQDSETGMPEADQIIEEFSVHRVPAV